MNPVQKAFIKMHTFLLKKTKGKRFNMGGTVLVLNTVGAKSGKARSNPLLYLPDDGSYLLAASAGGSPKHPGWYHNLKKTPDVTVVIKGETHDVTATMVSGDERTALYQRFEKLNARFTTYKNKTARTIPVIRLVARGAA